jgi:hypothetical protein
MNFAALTYSQVHDTAVQVVSEVDKNFIYCPPGHGQCVYVYEGAPSCIVGHILARLGTDIKTLVNWDNSVNSGIGSVALRDELNFNTDVLVFLRKLQGEQDNMSTWRRSLESASDLVDVTSY